MSLELKILQGEHANRSSFPIGSGDILTLEVDEGQSLKNMRVVLYDEKAQIRFIHRRKHGIASLDTAVPQFNKAGTWKLVLRAISPDGESIEVTKNLYVDVTSRTEAPSEVEIEAEELEAVEIAKVEEIDETISVPLTVLKGVGKVTAQKLNDGGIMTLKQLATSTLEEVVTTGLTENKSRTFIQLAQDYLKDNE